MPPIYSKRNAKALRAEQKAEFEKAKRYYDKAESVDLLMGYANVGRAVLQLAKGELARAQKTMEEVDAFHRASVPALLGKACAKFNNGHFREALKLYRKVFEVNPSPPPAVRLGLSYCYDKLGQPRLAAKHDLQQLHCAVNVALLAGVEAGLKDGAHSLQVVVIFASVRCVRGLVHGP